MLEAFQTYQSKSESERQSEGKARLTLMLTMPMALYVSHRILSTTNPDQEFASEIRLLVFPINHPSGKAVV